MGTRSGARYRQEAVAAEGDVEDGSSLRENAQAEGEASTAGEHGVHFHARQVVPAGRRDLRVGDFGPRMETDGLARLPRSAITQAHHPHIPRPLAHIEHNLVARHGHLQRTHLHVEQRPPRLVSMEYRDHSANGAFRSVQALSPNTAEAIALRHEVQSVAVRRPSRLIVPNAVRNRDPFRFGNRPALETAPQRCATDPL